MSELTNLTSLLTERNIIEKKIAEEHHRLLVNMSFTPLIDVSSCLISDEENSKPSNLGELHEKIPEITEDKWQIQRHQKKNNKKFKNNIVKRQNPSTFNEENIQITNEISIPAISVLNFDNVQNDGNMYYIPRANHFAQYINNKLYHGNVGIIYNNEKFPIKIKNCQYHSFDYNPKLGKCNYYHDPILYPESNDVRNYVSNSWKFMKSNDNKSEIKNNKDNTFGSINSIEEDIRDISTDDISRFNDMTFHNILYSMVISG
jgi:hypothetical protein